MLRNSFLRSCATLSALTTTLLIGSAAGAQGVASKAVAPQNAAPPARGPGAALALEAVQAAVTVCEANGYKVGVSVVDSAGVVRASLASDGARDRAVDSGTRKAFTAATLKASTASLAQQVTTDTALAARINADQKLWARAGGLPLLVGSEVIGAIGVGGAPGGEKDEACAAVAIEKIKSRLR